MTTTQDKIMDAVQEALSDALADETNYDGTFLALRFEKMSEAQQAEFFNSLANVVEQWTHYHGQQWAGMSSYLSHAGRALIHTIAEHVER